MSNSHFKVQVTLQKKMAGICKMQLVHVGITKWKASIRQIVGLSISIWVRGKNTEPELLAGSLQNIQWKNKPYFHKILQKKIISKELKQNLSS